MVQLEKAGVPTVVFVAKTFVKQWQATTRALGVEGLPFGVVPAPFVTLETEDIRADAERAFEEIVNGLRGPVQHPRTIRTETRAADVITIEAEDRYEALMQMNRQFLQKGWGDGFPLLDATRERVDAMLEGTRRKPEEVVAVLEPGMTLATVEKIAINAVMAGCQPGHLPVLLAAVEAMSNPRFAMRRHAQSTTAHGSLMLINGPIVKRLGINAGLCALGPGAQSSVNTVLGRALRLILMNVAHSYPGIMDMDTIGSPLKYSMCIAENEELSPWEPYHVEKGFGRDTSVVTVFSISGMMTVNDSVSASPEGVLNTLCSAASWSAEAAWLRGHTGNPEAGAAAKDITEQTMWLICPVHAAIYGKHGWEKPSLRDYVYKHARLPFRELIAAKEPATFKTSHPELQWLWDSPETLLPIFETPNDLNIAVAGAISGAKSSYLFGAAEPVSRPIEE